MCSMFLYYLGGYHARYMCLFCCFGVSWDGIVFLCGYKVIMKGRCGHNLISADIREERMMGEAKSVH